MQPGLRRDIQGLRAIAVLIVVLYHVGLVHGGYIGVDVFFVISGFLMGGLLLREQGTSGRVSVPGFFGRRVRRLLPALAVTTTVTALLGFVLLPVGKVIDSTARTGQATSLFYANIRLYGLASDYFAGLAEQNPLLHTWSLSVEEQFYFVLPVLMAACCLLFARRTALARRSFLIAMAVAAAGSFALSVLLVNGRWSPSGTADLAPFAFFHPTTRVWEFAAGVFLAAWAARRPGTESTGDAPASSVTRQAIVIVAIAAIIAATVAFQKSTPFPGLTALVPTLGGVVLLQWGRCVTPLRRVLESRPFVRIGDLSYGWYLWHWPLIVLARLNHADETVWLCAAALIALGLAWLTYRFVEEPFRHRRNMSGLRTLALAAVCVAVPLAAFTALGRVNRAQWTTLYRSFDVDRPSGGQAPPAPAPGLATAPRVVLVGDSHAKVMRLPFADEFAAAGMRLETISKPGCAFLAGVSSQPSNCAPWQRDTLRRLLAEPPAAVVIAGYTTSRVTRLKDGMEVDVSLWDADGRRAANETEALALYESGLRALVDDLDQAGIRVLLVSSIPDFMRGPFEDISLVEVIADRMHPRNTVLPLSAARERVAGVRSVEDRVSTQTSALTVIDPIPLLCTDACPQIDAGRLLYRDRDHVTYEAGRRIARAAIEQLSGLVAP